MSLAVGFAHGYAKVQSYIFFSEYDVFSSSRRLAYLCAGVWSRGGGASAAVCDKEEQFRDGLLLFVFFFVFLHFGLCRCPGFGTWQAECINN